MTERSATFRIAVRAFGPFERAIQAQWDLFELEHHTGLRLDAVPMELKTLEEALFHSAGMKTGEWDVAFVSTDWIASLFRQKTVLDLSSMLARDPPAGFPLGWTPSLLKLQCVDNAVLGVPYHNGPECLIYRRDLFEDPRLRQQYRTAFGRELAPPVTWQEFHQIASFLQRPKRRFYGSVFAAFPDGHNTVYDFLLQLWSRGGELVDKLGQLRFETPAAVEALTFYRTILADETAVHPESSFLDSVGAGKAFTTGEVAMMINWFGFATLAHTAQSSAVQGRVGIAPVPRGEYGTVVSLNVYWLLSIAAASPHAEIAWRFLRHLLTPEMDKLTTLSGAIGCRRSTWCDRDVNQAIPFYHHIERLHECAREVPQREDWPRVAAIIDDLVTATITGNIAVSELLRQADAKILAESRQS